MEARARLVERTESARRLGARRLGREAGPDELLGAQLEMKADLFIHVGARVGRAAEGEAEEAADAGADLEWSARHRVSPSSRPR